MAGWILLGVVVLVGVYAVILYNGLVELRNRIENAWARLFYNDTVFRYNAKIESFPALLIARSLQFRAREYFEADDTLRAPVQVDF